MDDMSHDGHDHDMHDAATQKATIPITGMHCASCARSEEHTSELQSR